MSGGALIGRFETLPVGEDPARLYVTGEAVPTAPAIVVFHPWWGLNDDVLAFADRLGARGFHVLAPDLVRGRVAATIEDAERLATEADPKRADAVALATIDRLARPKVGALGFSFGAAWSLWCAAQRPQVAASVVYYGTMTGPSLAKASVPVLGHFAAQDPYEPEDNLQAFEKELRQAGRALTLHRYQGTGHWFAEPSRDAWRREAAELAFERTVSFLSEHVPGV